MNTRTVVMTVIFAVTLPALALATPPWIQWVDESGLNETAHGQWQQGADAWDRLDHHGAIHFIERAATTQMNEANLWLALASAIVDAHSETERQAALDQLDLAAGALNRAAALPALSQTTTLRIRLLRRSIAQEMDVSVDQLISQAQDPLRVRELRPGLVPPTPSNPATPPPGIAGSGGDFYSQFPNYRNGNYNVLARRESQLQGSGYRGGPRNVSLGTSALTRGGTQPTPVGFGTPTANPDVFPRRILSPSVRTPAN